MQKQWRTFLLLLGKAFIVRKRHYILTLFQIIFPVLIFTLILNIKHMQEFTYGYIEEESTYYPILSKKSMIALVNRQLTNVYYVPRNNFTMNLMNYTRDCLELPNNNIIGFTTEKDMLETYMEKQFNVSYSQVLAIVFNVDNTRSVPTNLKYTLRPSIALSSDLFHSALIAATTSENDFVNTLPFTQVQMCLDESFIRISAPKPTFQTKLSIQKMPIIHQSVDKEQNSELKHYLVYPTVIVFLASFLIEPTYIVAEKFIGITILMATNGVRSYQNLLSWIISGMMLGTVYVSLVVVELKLPLFTNTAYVQYGNGFLLWLALFLNLAHWIANGLHIGAYFWKPQFANIGLCLWLIATLLISNNLLLRELYTLVSCLGILMPCSMLTSIFEEFNAYEYKLTGMQWSYLFVPAKIPSAKTTSLGATMIFSILGIILNFLLAIYIHAILPGKYGVARHPLFFLQRMNKNRICNESKIEDIDDAVKNDKRFETISKDALTPGIQIRNLKMTYSDNLFHKSAVQALKGVSVDFYKGLITALLGHNGAGKTTLMSIIIGLTNPTDGSVFINGKSVSNDLDSIRKDLGVCPQDDMLFPDLTVYEHIEFFAKLKGDTKTKKQLKHEIDSLLSNLGITYRKNFIPQKLSGAQKRRLCLGIALAGDASVLILDEPTSGMDPEGRRFTWDLLLKLRGKKTIIITTHSIDEADILGDRIAIMHTGRMISYGTSMFLKKLYGHGCLEVTLSTESWSDSKRIQDAVGLNAQVRSIGNGRIALSIPHTEELPRTLDKLERQKKQLGVTGISVSLITLEQVFLMITEEEEKEEESQLQDSIDPIDAVTTHPDKLTGWKFILQSIFTLFEKKMTYSAKNQWTYCLIAILCVLGIVSLAFCDKKTKEILTPQSLTLDLYDNSQTWYSSESEILDKNYRKVVESYNSIARKVDNTSNMNEALLSFTKADFPVYRNSFIVAAEFNVTQDVVNANGLFSGMATKSIPISVNLLSNALIKSLAGDDYSIDISVLALPDILSSYKLNLSYITINAIIKTVVLICLLFLAVCLFVQHPLHENTIGVKQLQRMTGISGFSYWGVIYVIDLLLVFCTILLMVAFVCLIDSQLDIRIYRVNEISITIILLLLFFLGVLPLVYIFSFLRKSSKTVLLILYLVPGILLFTEIVLYGIAKVQEDYSMFKKIYSVLHKIFLVIPHVSFTYGHFAFMRTAALNARCRSLPKAIYKVVCVQHDICCGLKCADGSCEKSIPYFNNFDSENSLEECMIYLAVAPLFFFLVIGLLEKNIFIELFARLRRSITRPKEDQEKIDDDVKREEDLIVRAINIRRGDGQTNEESGLYDMIPNCNNSTKDEHDGSTLFLAYGLCKNYGKVKAVKNVSFRVKKHECFGFLGVNGAGKSTTFRMLTGEELPSGGMMFLGPYNIQSNRKKYLEQMGYCPQSHALISSLNAWEHLRLFAGLRGVPRSCINQEVAKWINLLNLKACAKQSSKTYSGGNKRRLSIAIALIGGPRLVLLDEPTTGVDPAARKSLWKTIRSCQAAGQAIIFTSHNMEESEALCDRLVIMVDGRLVCVGASQQLKQKFGAGFDISIKLNPKRDDDIVKKIKQDIECALTCTLRDENIGYLAYHVDNPDTTWQTMFQALDNLKNNYEVIEDFVILSSTLEQLFMQFARVKNDSAQSQSTVPHSSMNVIVNRTYMP